MNAIKKMVYFILLILSILILYVFACLPKISRLPFYKILFFKSIQLCLNAFAIKINYAITDDHQDICRFDAHHGEVKSNLNNSAFHLPHITRDQDRKSLPASAKLIHEYISNLPKQYIIIANHVSALDGFILFAHFPDCYVVSDIEHGDIPILGRIMKRLPYLGVDRKSAYAKIVSMDDIIRVLSSGKSIIIFPQGETAKTIDDHFKDGPFNAAKKTNVAVVPIFLEFQPLDVFYFGPPWNILTSFKKIYKAHKKYINIHLHKPIFANNFLTQKQFREHVITFYKNCYEIYHDVREVDTESIIALKGSIDSVHGL